jgi:Double zinc ribbon
MGEVLFQISGRPAPSDGATFMAWVGAFLIAGAILFLVVRPLLVVEPVSGKPKTRSNPLNAEQEAVLDNLYERLAATEKSLEELEYDKEYDALTEADYQDLRERYSVRMTAIQTEISEKERLLRERRDKVITKRPSAKSENGNGKVKDEVKKLIANPATLLAPKKEAKETLKCSECATPYKSGDKYCSNCQAPLPTSCAECGTELQASHKFCPECGTPIRGQ